MTMVEGRREIGHVMTGLSVAADRARDQGLSQFALSPLEYRILEMCGRGQASTVTELARMFPVDASTVSRTVSRLVDRRLVARRRTSRDRRTVRLRLTAEGRDIVDELAERMAESSVALLAGIDDDDRAVFMAAARKIMANMQDLDGRFGPRSNSGKAAPPGALRSPAQQERGELAPSDRLAGSVGAAGS